MAGRKPKPQPERKRKAPKEEPPAEAKRSTRLARVTRTTKGFKAN